MSLQTRLAKMKEYREEALKHPKANKLYIEDLDLSIVMFEKAQKRNIEVLKGFDFTDEDV